MGASGMITIPYVFLLMLLLSILIGLSLILIGDTYIRKEYKQIILMIIVLVISLMLQNYFEYRLATDWTNRKWRTIVSIYGYSVRPVLIVLFYYTILDRKKMLLSWILVCVNAVIYLTSLFSPIVFSISQKNHFMRGPLGYTCHIITFLLLANLLLLTIKKTVFTDKLGAWIPFFNTLLIILAVILDSVGNRLYPISLLTVAVSVACILYYSWLHLLFVREHEHDLEAQHRIQIMISQIQPHFLYNTLSTIRALCRKDPEMAAEITEKFGSYLRQNLDSLSLTGLIPFQKELEHTMTYTDIEMVRFENIDVEYDIRETEFSVPPLCLQPIVENSIRHGVRIREQGRIRVSTDRKEGYYEIRVEDNGVGFDVSHMKEADESHIGIRNVRERIESMCKGQLIIESRKDEGTTVRILIPTEDKR